MIGPETLRSQDQGRRHNGAPQIGIVSHGGMRWTDCLAPVFKSPLSSGGAEQNRGEIQNKGGEASQGIC